MNVRFPGCFAAQIPGAVFFLAFSATV